MQSLSSFRKPPIDKTVGIEIECFYSVFVTVERRQYSGFFYATSDGSINPDNWSQTAIEWVSQPLTCEWLKKEIVKLEKKYGNWMWNESCGIHIHVSRKWLSEKKAGAIYAFIQSLSEDDYLHFFGRTTNNYCRTHYALGHSRYSAVNIENKHTVEIRVFRSGDAAWAQYCVDCVKYMVDHAYHLNVEAFSAFRRLYNV